jgi:2-(1,2-epoxy-1,2-dihydrophenyl)acetyl-CoA isomerase
MPKHVSVRREQGIATIVLDRPEVYNAFTRDMIGELNEALEQVQVDENIYVVVVTGAGDGFCTGADIGSMPDWTTQSKSEYAAFINEVQDVVRNLRSLAKPSIAAVNGPAVGAGCDFALACDVRYVASDASLREGFIQVGLVPGDGGAWLLPKLIGDSRAREYLLSGIDIPAEEAVEIGLASASTDDALASAKEFARELRNLPSTAIRHTNRLISGTDSFEDHCQQAIDYQWECINDPEHDEAVAAFRDGREPEYDR